jgi:hypothetical protein
MVSTEFVEYADERTTNRYLKPIWVINYKKGVGLMVDIDRIKSDIADLEILTAEEYCRPQVEAIYAEFEESRARQISELRTSLEVFERYRCEKEETEETGAE